MLVSVDVLVLFLLWMFLTRPNFTAGSDNVDSVSDENTLKIEKAERECSTKVLSKLYPNDVTTGLLESFMVSSPLECGFRCIKKKTCRSFSEEEKAVQQHECHLLSAKAYDMCTVVNDSSKSGSYYSIQQIQEKIFTLHHATHIEDECYEVEFPVQSSSDYIQIEEAFPKNLSSFSFCGWIKATPADNDMYLWNYGTGTAYLNIFQNRAFHLVINGVAYLKFAAGYPVFTDDQWHFICTTWNNADGAADLYIDAILALGTGPIQALSGFNLQANQQLIIGQSVQDGFPQELSFKGKITGFNFYGYILTAEEIKNLSLYCYNSGGNLLAWNEMKNHLVGSVTVNNDEPSCMGF